MRIITAVATIAFAAASAHAESHRLDKKWETQAQLKIPESVLFDPERKVLYVSNIDGEPWARPTSFGQEAAGPSWSESHLARR